VNQNAFDESRGALAGELVDDWRSLPEGEPAAVRALAEEQERGSEGWIVLRSLVFFLLILAAFALGLNGLITLGLWHIKTGQYGVSNRMIRGEINAQIVINGSSRALSGFDPRIIQATTGLTAYNIGRNGSQTDMQLAVLKTYLEHNRKPEIVIQSLDSFSFEATREVYNPAQYVPYLYDRELWTPLRRINPGIWKSRYVPLYGYVVDDMSMSWVLGLGELVGWSQREDYFLGFNPRPLKWTDEFKSFRAANPNGVDWPIDEEGKQSLEELIQVCRAHEVKLIFVYAPEYSEMQKLTRNRSEVFRDLHDLSERYSVPLWDYSDWRYSAETKYFQNSQHLNEEGAQVFSEDLSNRLQGFISANPFQSNGLQVRAIADDRGVETNLAKR
jgi:hypothetical protein